MNRSTGRHIIASTTNQNVVSVSYPLGSDRAADAGAYVYEVDMLLFTLGRYLTELSDHGPGSREHDARLEAFLVHARVLISFFYPTGRRHDDDVVAEDFLHEPMDNTAPEALRLINHRVALDKRLSHLTQKRRQAHAGYPVIEIAGDLLALHGVFTRRLSEADPNWTAFDSLSLQVREFEQRHGHEYRGICASL